METFIVIEAEKENGIEYFIDEFTFISFEAAVEKMKEIVAAGNVAKIDKLVD